MATRDKRLHDLESKVKPPDDSNSVVVDWGGDFLTVNGIDIPREQYEREHAGELVIEWGDDGKIRKHRRGAIVVNSETVARNSG
jgi:hypothetical protein